jgi:recombination protein RecA
MVEKDIYSKLGITTLAEELNSDVRAVLPLNLLPLDVATGIGGLPRGRFVAVIGQFSTCKSTLALLAISNNQADGGTTLIVDTENVYEKSRMEEYGIDITDPKVHIIQDVTIEKLNNILGDILRATKVEDKLLIVWDTVSATPVNAELEPGVDPKKIIGTHARLISAMFRGINSLLTTTQSTMLLVAQPKIDPMMGTVSFIGEKPVKFHASIIVDLSKQSADEARMVVRFKVTKNKVAPPFKAGQISYYQNGGMDYLSSFDPFVSSTAFYGIGGKKYKRGASRKAILENQEEVIKTIQPLLYTNYKIPYRVLIKPRKGGEIEVDVPEGTPTINIELDNKEE